MINRIRTSRKNKFGIDLYNLLINLDESNTIGGVLKIPSLFCANEAAIKQPFTTCRNDIKDYEQQKEHKELEIHHITNNREKSKPAITSSQMARKAGSRISDAANEAKLQLDISLLDRSIQQRKEQFGNEVYDIACTAILALPSSNLNSSSNHGTSSSSTDPNTRKGIRGMFVKTKSAVSKNLSKLNSTEADIKNCLLIAKRDIDFLIKQKSSKESEIAALSK